MEENRFEKKKCTRRDFLSKSLKVGAGAAALPLIMRGSKLFAGGKPETEAPEKRNAADVIKDLQTVDADEKGGTVNFKTWSGYDAPAFLNPFEEKYGTKVAVDLFIDNPEAYAEIKGGKYNYFDLCTFDMGWMVPLVKDGLVMKLDKDVWIPTVFQNYIPFFHPDNYKYCFLNEKGEFDSNGDLYGLPQRFGAGGAYANTDVVPESVWRESYDWVWNPGRDYNTGTYERFDWNIQHVMLHENINPYKVHTEDEIERTRESCIQLLQNCKAFYSSMTAHNQALLQGEIDVIIEGSNFNSGILRKQGELQFQTIVPKRHSARWPENIDTNAGGIVWVETTMIVNNPKLHPATYDFLYYIQQGDPGYALSVPPGEETPVLVPQKGAWDKYTQEERTVLEADYMMDLLQYCVPFQGVPDLEKFAPIWEEAKLHLGEKHQEAHALRIQLDKSMLSG